MTKDELKLVLEALKWCHGGEPCGTAEAIAVVEKALAQRTWVGLTDEEIDAVTDSQWAKGVNKPIYAAHRAYARAIEAKVKEKNSV